MQIQKILSYDVYGASPQTSYQFVCDLLAQKIDPPSAEISTLDCHNREVFCSPLTRAVSCLDTKTIKHLTICAPLREIPFSLADHCNQKKFNEARGSAVREAFLSAFTSDTLLVSHQDLRTELLELLALCQENPNALAISHTFKMKCLLIYSKIGDSLFTDSKKIYDYLEPTTKILNFGESIFVR